MFLNDAPAKSYLSTTFEIRFYDKLCSPFPIVDYSHLLTGCKGPRDFELRTELVRSVRKNRGLSTILVRAMRLINSLLDGKNENVPYIH